MQIKAAAGNHRIDAPVTDRFLQPRAAGTLKMWKRGVNQMLEEDRRYYVKRLEAITPKLDKQCFRHDSTAGGDRATELVLGLRPAQTITDSSLVASALHDSYAPPREGI